MASAMPVGKQRPCFGCYQVDDAPTMELSCGHLVHKGVALRVPRSVPGKVFFHYGHEFACACYAEEAFEPENPLHESLARALRCAECSQLLTHLECVGLFEREIYLQYGLERQTAPLVAKALASLSAAWLNQVTMPASPAAQANGSVPSPSQVLTIEGKVTSFKQLVDLVYFYKATPHPRMGEILTEAMLEANLREAEQEKAMDLIDKLMSGRELEERKPAKGVGYGGNEKVVLSKNVAETNRLSKQQQKKDSDIEEALRQLRIALDQCGNNLGAATEAAFRKEWGALSCLAEYLRNGSLTDIMDRFGVYRAVFDLCDALASNAMLIPLMISCKPLKKMIKWSAEAAVALAKQKGGEPSGIADLSKHEVEGPSLLESITALRDTVDDSSPEEIQIKSRCIHCIALIASNRYRHPHMELGSDEASILSAAIAVCNSPSASIVDKSNHYKRVMRKYSFRMANFEALGISHAFAAKPQQKSGGLLESMSSWARGGGKEHLTALKNTISSLRTSCPLEWYSSIFCLVDENRYDLLKFLIIGPDETPYQDGCFEFDVFLPPTFPNDPPLAKFMTTGGGKVRFNPNLYQDGKICLSLLGTWAGPKWNPKESTVLQVLLSLQSLVLVSDPMCNEPGHENMTQTFEGMRMSEHYNQNIREHAARLAILGMLENPIVGFEDTIRDHFRLKKSAVVASCTKAREKLHIVSATSFDAVIQKLGAMFEATGSALSQ